MNIYIIGLPGSGKSTLGKKLAYEMNKPYIDLDLAIEQQTGQSIPDIFEREGELAFRQIESEMLKKTLNQNAVIATGGGIVTKRTNKTLMQGIIVFLDVNLLCLEKRLKASRVDRPLLFTQSLHSLYEKRLSLYHYFADITITNNENPEQGVSRLKQKIPYYFEPKKEGETMKRVLVLHGPNLNMLGVRDEKHYGTLSLEAIEDLMRASCSFELVFKQSNHEGDLIDWIQEARTYDGLIINPGAYTHTSVALRDALEILKIPKVEVHLSAIEHREPFRQINLIRDVMDFQVSGQKEKGYLVALDYLKNHCFVI